MGDERKGRREGGLVGIEGRRKASEKRLAKRRGKKRKKGDRKARGIYQLSLVGEN